MSKFACPKPQCNGRTFDSLRGWKTHMSGHGGYDAAELAQVAGVAQPAAGDDVRARMATLAQTMPSAGGDTDASGETTANEHPRREDAPPAPAPQPEVRRVQFAPKKFKKLVGSLPGKILEHNGIELDSEDEAILSELGEFMGEVFGVEFSVPATSVTIESRFLAFIAIAGVMLVIYLKHKFPEVWKLLNQNRQPKRKVDEPKPEAVN
jgi:hypothetical protein